MAKYIILSALGNFNHLITHVNSYYSPLKRAHGVPWPTWNGVGGPEVMQDLFRIGIVGYLCKHFYDDNLPNGICQGAM